MRGTVKPKGESNIVLLTIITFFIGFIGYMIWHPYPYNTEQVCFNDEGEIAFYAQGFKPSETPVTEIAPKTYKILETGKKLDAIHCRWTWGAKPPKGRGYWELKVD